MLNKFPVLDLHPLIVTRRFLHQEVVLDKDDFDALARCLEDVGGLGFYNDGEEGGNAAVLENPFSGSRIPQGSH